MAQFRARIQGQRGEASRLGSKKSGIWSRTNGWHAGVVVDGIHQEGRGDRLYITTTGGSGYNSYPSTYLGWVEDGGKFVPSQELIDSIQKSVVPAWVERPPQGDIG